MQRLAMLFGVGFGALASVQSAEAADLGVERDLGLIVSGVVDQWAGVQIIDDGVTDDTLFTNGGEGLLSLPLGDNLSIQSDVKYEYNSNALESPSENNVFGPRYAFQGAAHLSWRDPSSLLLGVFGGVGGSSSSIFRQDVRFVGGEAQAYLGDVTLYVQGGYVDFDNLQATTNAVLPSGLLLPDEGLFARGVLRWFLTTDSRLQIEGTYVSLDLDNSLFGGITPGEDVDIFSVGARYDFTMAGLPMIGDTPLYVAYRGTFRDNCNFTGGDGVDDHTFMVGTRYSFSGDMLTVDRQGATLDTPDFDNSCRALGQSLVSDRRLKTDIVALGDTESGIKLYSWKYRSDLVTTWVGVMAQELLESYPEALARGEDGFWRVRYDKIDVQMMTLEQWNARYL